MQSGEARCFLFLQGPHGPFFAKLGKILESSGACVWRVGFNAGDKASWPDSASYISFEGQPRDWAGVFAEMVAKLKVTDIVVYGDTRPIHQTALQIAHAAGLNTHIFEEGYLRPYWITYERDGVNGNSKLVEITLPEIRRALSGIDTDLTEAPAHWGDMREHVYHAVRYHWQVFWGRKLYPRYRSHRTQTTLQEFRAYLRKFLWMPFTALSRMIKTKRIKSGGFPYHLALLQLEHDANFVAHSPFETMEQFIDLTITGFAQGAPTHHHLVFKAHPLDSGQGNHRKTIHTLAQKAGISNRVHYVAGGRLGELLDSAKSAIAVNSTAAQQALWRGLPVRAHGAAVYVKPELTSKQPLEEFFAVPNLPDMSAYRDYRNYLLKTSQVPGSFYSTSGRQQALRRVVDMMLAEHDPYEALRLGREAPRQQLRIVK